VKATQVAGIIARHHLTWGDNGEAACACGWSDLVALFGYHLLDLFMDLADADEEDGRLVAVPEVVEVANPGPLEPAEGSDDPAVVAETFRIDGSYTGTARRLGISVPTVKRRLAEAGLDPRLATVRAIENERERRIRRFT
jgi:hypothetical protein